jgi:hypothetical protein
MSNLNLSLVAGYDVDAPSQRKRAAPPKFSLTALFERLSDRMYAAERKDRESKVARYINDNGGVLTDELERQISRNFGRIVE